MSNGNIFLKSGFLKTHSNGLGRYVCQLQRVALKFCKNHGSSKGMRDFVETDLVDFAKCNPGTVVYLKPRRHRSAVISAEFLNGEKQWVSCHNLSKEEIKKWLYLLKTQSSNNKGFRLRKLQHTDQPSIQGPWTPFTYKDPAENLAEYPSAKLCKLINQPKSATDKLLHLFKENMQITSTK